MGFTSEFIYLSNVNLWLLKEVIYRCLFKPLHNSASALCLGTQIEITLMSYSPNNSMNAGVRRIHKMRQATNKNPNLCFCFKYIREI